MTKPGRIGGRSRCPWMTVRRPVRSAAGPATGTALGSEVPDTSDPRGKNTHTFVGSVSLVALPEAEDFRKYDIHVHVPAGAVPKDGPSAGVAMFTALASLFTNTPVRSDVAMTGEITLRGLVLPIGGLKEKSLAAMRAGISTVLIPKLNEKDLVEIPEEAKQKLKFVPVETVDEVLANALDRTGSDQHPT